jgi:endonuclease/exonuclease/phosphatase (EEP) superfamily protein YafD
MRYFSWAAAGVCAGWAAGRLAGVDRLRSVQAPLAPLMSFTPYVAAAAPLGSLLLRRKSSAAGLVLGGSGVVLGALVLPRVVKRRRPEARGPVLRILTANLLFGMAEAEAVVELVRRTGADVLFVQELTDDAVTRLKQAGLGDLLGHEMLEGCGDDSHGSGIYSRFPLGEGIALGPSSMAQPTARLELPAGGPVDLVCVHPRSPVPMSSHERVARWRADLSVLPPPADPPRILAGDFNATLDHALFRRLLRLGHVDAAVQVGDGLRPTWGPKGRPAILTIDHVLLDPRCAVLRTSVHMVPGSDHRALYAEIRLPG